MCPIGLFISNYLKCIFNDYDSDIRLFRVDALAIVKFKENINVKKKVRIFTE